MPELAPVTKAVWPLSKRSLHGRTTAPADSCASSSSACRFRTPSAPPRALAACRPGRTSPSCCASENSSGLPITLPEAARQREAALVREVVEVLPVVLVRLAEDIPRRETSAESRPRNSHAAEDEAHVRMPGRPRDDRQQVASHVDLSRPELDEGQIVQLREVAAEVLDDPPDDAGIVVRILEERRDRACRRRAAGGCPPSA